MIAVRRSIEQLKKDAKRLKRETGISHAEALNRVAAGHGFQSWETLLAGRNPPANRIPLLSLPKVDGADFSVAQPAAEWSFVLPVFLPIIGAAGVGKTIMMLRFARELLGLGFGVSYIAPAEISFLQEPWTEDVGAKQARELLRTAARFTAFDRKTIHGMGNHYLAVFEQIAPGSIVLLDDPLSLPGMEFPVSSENPIDLSPLFARGCRVVVILQDIIDLKYLRLGNEPSSVEDVVSDSEIALLGFHRPEVGAAPFLDQFAFGDGMRFCLRKPPLPLGPSKDRFPFWLIQGGRTAATCITLVQSDLS